MGLVISRRDGENIILTGTLGDGEKISIQVSHIKQQIDRTKVYIEAPDSINILRGELVNRVKQ